MTPEARDGLRQLREQIDKDVRDAREEAGDTKCLPVYLDLADWITIREALDGGLTASPVVTPEDVCWCGHMLKAHNLRALIPCEQCDCRMFNIPAALVDGGLPAPPDREKP